MNTTLTLALRHAHELFPLGSDIVGRGVAGERLRVAVHVALAYMSGCVPAPVFGLSLGPRLGARQTGTRFGGSVWVSVRARVSVSVWVSVGYLG